MTTRSPAAFVAVVPAAGRAARFGGGKLVVDLGGRTMLDRTLDCLLDAGAATLRDEGFDRGLLWVLEANTRARRFYERQGWRVGKPIRVEDIGGNQVTEVRYEIDLTDPL
jgi:CTP:molybdopterin cytidylyltransferase MocA